MPGPGVGVGLGWAMLGHAATQAASRGLALPEPPPPYPRRDVPFYGSPVRFDQAHCQATAGPLTCALHPEHMDDRYPTTLAHYRWDGLGWYGAPGT